MGVPVLLLVYNRPDQTKEVLKVLSDLGVGEVYVSGDGPNGDNDRIQTDKVRSAVNEHESIVAGTQFSLKHEGCRTAVLEGINWFFKTVEEGVIIEDDCIPSLHFFQFCSGLLKRYRTDSKVKMICGNNPLGNWETSGGYFFSRIGHIWGWATWKDRWQPFDPELPGLNNFVVDGGFQAAFGPTALASSRQELAEKSTKGTIDTWDHQWNAHILMGDGLAAIPSKNLVKNIGFGSNGTHLHDEPNWINNEVSAQSINIDNVPMVIDREYEMELYLSQKCNEKAISSSESFRVIGRKGSDHLRVVLINSTDLGGGAETVARSIHEKLLGTGHESTLLVQERKTEFQNVVEIGIDFKQQLYELNPDVIHIHNLHGTSISLDEIVRISLEFPVVMTLHDSWLLTGSICHPFQIKPSSLSYLQLREWNRILRERQGIISSSAIRFTAPSQWMREFFFLRHGIRPHFVPNGIKVLQEEPFAPPSDRFILFVANRPTENPYKDFDTLRKGWKLANEKLGEEGCDLVCVGGEPFRDQIGNNSILVLDRQSSSKIFVLMKHALLLIQASRQDNSPLTILEAHACNTFVLGSLVGGIPELLSPKETEYMYEPGNADGLSDSLVSAIRYLDKIEHVSELPPTPTVEEMTEVYIGHYHTMVNG